MRKVTRDAVAAFYAGRNFRSGNTEVTYHERGIPYAYSVFTLFGNKIATYCQATGVLRVTMAGHPTMTTRERLNGIVSEYRESADSSAPFGGFFQDRKMQRFGLDDSAEIDPWAWYKVEREIVDGRSELYLVEQI